MVMADTEVEDKREIFRLVKVGARPCENGKRHRHRESRFFLRVGFISAFTFRALGNLARRSSPDVRQSSEK